MDENNEKTNGNGFHLKTRWGVINAKRGSEVIAIISLLMLAGAGFGMFQAAFALSDAMRSIVKEQRRMSCIMSVAHEEREAQWSNPNSHCNRDAERT